MYQRPIVKYNYIMMLFDNEDFKNFILVNLDIIKTYRHKPLDFVNNLSIFDKIKLQCRLIQYPTIMRVNDLISCYVLFLEHSCIRVKPQSILDEYK